MIFGHFKYYHLSMIVAMKKMMMMVVMVTMETAMTITVTVKMYK